MKKKKKAGIILSIYWMMAQNGLHHPKRHRFKYNLSTLSKQKNSMNLNTKIQTQKTLLSLSLIEVTYLIGQLQITKCLKTYLRRIMKATLVMSILVQVDKFFSELILTIPLVHKKVEQRKLILKQLVVPVSLCVANRRKVVL